MQKLPCLSQCVCLMCSSWKTRSCVWIRWQCMVLYVRQKRGGKYHSKMKYKVYYYFLDILRREFSCSAMSSNYISKRLMHIRHWKYIVPQVFFHLINMTNNYLLKLLATTLFWAWSCKETMQNDDTMINDENYQEIQFW